MVDAFPGLRFSNLVAMVSLPGNDSLLFVAEKPGRIRKLHLGTSPSMETFLDIRDRVRVGPEHGLLRIPVDFSKYPAGFFKMRIDWPEAPNAEVEP